MAGEGGDDGISHQLSVARAHIWSYLGNLVTCMSLKCAIQLGIPDAIHSHAHPITLPRLSAAVGIPPSKTPHLARLMRLLVHTHFFALQKIENDNPEKEEGEEGYVLTPCSKLLLKGVEPTMTPLVLFSLDPLTMKTHHFLSTWFQQGKSTTTPTPTCSTVFEAAHGAPLFEFAAGNPEFGGFFNEGMASDAGLTMAIVLSKCGHVFQGLRSLVDVGGGTGAAAEAIASAFPHIKCSAFDLPHGVGSAPERTNVTLLAGDMFQSIPSADAVLLKWVLHDWSDEECMMILKRCKEAIPSREEGGKVIIIEMVVNDINGARGDEKETEMQLAVDVWTMMDTTGKERDEKEWRNIIFHAGFADYKITPISGTPFFEFAAGSFNESTMESVLSNGGHVFRGLRSSQQACKYQTD
ncbi:hypothetical protein ACLOJK_009760 [Asimina triloba]